MQTLACIALVTGVAMMVLSLAWPRATSSRSNWSDQQALDYQTKSARLHELSHQYAHAAVQGNVQAVELQLERARREYDQARDKLDAAVARPKHIAWTMRFSGMMLAGIGIATLFLRRDQTAATKA
jgi:hypothetical protein